MMIRTRITLAIIASTLGMANAQPEEFKTVYGIITALYSSISGPAGARDGNTIPPSMLNN